MRGRISLIALVCLAFLSCGSSRISRQAEIVRGWCAYHLVVQTDVTESWFKYKKYLYSPWIVTAVGAHHLGVGPFTVDSCRAAGAMALASIGAKDLIFASYPTGGAGAYYDTFRVYMPEEFFARDTRADPDSAYDRSPTTPLSPDRFWIPQSNSIAALCAFLRNVNLAKAAIPPWGARPIPFERWSGIYLDECTDSIPSTVWSALRTQEVLYGAGLTYLDIDGDGFPDDSAKIHTTYKANIHDLVSAVRESFPTKIIIANTAWRFDDPNLNGITIEDIRLSGGGKSVDSAVAWFRGQKSVSGYDPWMGIGWLYSRDDNVATELSVTGIRAVMDSVPGVIFGRIKPYTGYTQPAGLW